MLGLAMNLRLTPKERWSGCAARGEREHRSMHEFVRLAVLIRIEEAERRDRVLELTDQVMAEHAHTLARLKEL